MEFYSSGSHAGHDHRGKPERALREVLRNTRERSSGGGIGAVPQFQSEPREITLKNLNSVSYLDFQKIDWPWMKNRWIEEAKKSPVV